MVLPDEAGVRVAAHQVTMVIDEVRRVAHHTMGQLSTDAHDHKSNFTSVDTDLGQFGDVPRAHALGEHHRAAHQIFVETYQGVIDDLVAFRDNLLACADAHHDNDEQVQAALLRLGRDYQHHSFASDQQNRRGLRDHNNELYDAHRAERLPDHRASSGHGGQQHPSTLAPSADPTKSAGQTHAGELR